METEIDESQVPKYEEGKKGSNSEDGVLNYSKRVLQEGLLDLARHDASKEGGKNNYEELIDGFFKALTEKGQLRPPTPTTLKYICKQCLRQLKGWKGVKDNLKIKEEALKSRMELGDAFTENATENISPFVATSGEPIMMIMPLSSRTPKKTSNRPTAPQGTETTPIPPPKKVIIIQSSKSLSTKASTTQLEATTSGKLTKASVLIKATWPSGSKQKYLSDDLCSLGCMLVRGTYKQIANAALRNPRLRQEIVKKMLKEIDHECSQLSMAGSRKKPVELSLLRRTSQQNMENFSFEHLGEELEKRCPLLWKVLEVASLRPRQRVLGQKGTREGAKETAIKARRPRMLLASGMAASVLLKNRSPKMTALQLLITIIIQHSGMTGKLNRLRQLRLVTSHTFFYKMLDKFGCKHDKHLKENRFQPTLDRKIRPDKGAILAIDNCRFLPSDDLSLQRRNYINLCGRIACENIKCLESFGEVTVRHIKHKYSHITCKKTDKKFIGFVYANSNESAGMQEVLEHVQTNYTALSENTDAENIHSNLAIVGDQGSIERGVNVLLQLRNGLDPSERLDALHMELADFHTGMKFLQYGYDNFYNTKGSSDKCTMYAERNMINRRNVVVDVSRNYDACKQFFLLEIRARIIACYLKILGISDLDDEPAPGKIPQGVLKGQPSLRTNFIRSLSGEVVDKFILQSQQNEERSARQKYADWLIHSNQKTADGRYKCRHTGCTVTFRYDGKKRVEHEKSHGLHLEVDTLHVSVVDDDMFSY
eukprot:gene993-306_t